MSYPGKRGALGERRLLGDTRREVVEAHHVAASRKRSRLASANFEDEEEDGPNSRTLGDNDAAVFADAIYEEDDVEADKIYAAVDERVNAHSTKQHQKRLKKEQKEQRRANPTISQQFADLKAELGAVSAEQWASIPDIGDYSVQKQKFEKLTPAPDSLLERARQETAYVTSEPANFGTATDLASIGAGRVSVLGQKLDNAGNLHAENAAVDADGYLNAMAGVRVSTQTEIGDIKKARLLLKSVTATNPNHAPGWIAAARLEETAGNLTAARDLILEGCQKCPRHEDVWVEATRLYPKQTGRRILARAVRTVPRSVKVWLQAATLEDDVPARRRVLRKSLEIMPRSAALWRAAVELEEPTAARILLSRAVECVPKATELWLALAHLENYEEAKDTLKRAQNAISTDPSICITAAQLEETQNGEHGSEISAVIERGVTALSQTEAKIGRDKWLQAAEKCYKSGYPGTVKAIVENVIDLDVLDAEREAIWMEDANRMESKGIISAARAIYYHLTQTFPTRVDLWQAYVDFERRCGEKGRVQELLLAAVICCPKAELLWLMLAKDKWKTDGAEAARQVLSQAFEMNEDSEAIWLAAAKVETESGKFKKARSILRRARQAADSERVYMKSALLERLVNKPDDEKELLEQGLDRFPKAEKLWLMLAQWYERLRDSEINGVAKAGFKSLEKIEVRQLQSARAVYSTAVEHCRTCITLWIGYARYEERHGGSSRARAILERGRERCKGRKDLDRIWREGGYLEMRARDPVAARVAVGRGLKVCRQSGILWALAIGIEARTGQKAKSADGIRACPESGMVLTEIARFLWRGGRIDKAREWFRRAVEMEPEIGDSWATWVAFEREVGDAERVKKVFDAAVLAEPRVGEGWINVSKQPGNEGLEVENTLTQVSSMRAWKECCLTGNFGAN